MGKTTLRPFRPNDGGYVRADARGYQFLLDYQGAGGAFPAQSLDGILSGEIDPGMFRDKVVIIGVRAQSVKDLFYTPHSRGRAERQQFYGIDLHAHIVSQLLRHALDGTPNLAVLSERVEVLWILLWALIGGFAGLRTLSVWRFSSVWAGGSFALLLGTYVLFTKGLWIPWVPAALCWSGALAAVTAYLSSLEKRQRNLLMRIFSQHVSREIAEAVWQNRDEFLRGGRPRSQKMLVTVLFSDLEGYTTVSEKMDPQDLMDWLNMYLEAMAALIADYSGVVDDYVGDGIKANFGVPFPRHQSPQIAQDAVNAVNCALAMGERIEKLNAVWMEKHLPAVRVRIGIYTGTVIAGSLGSSERLKYTTVGDTVNIAARLESYDKRFGTENLCRILVGDTTWEHLEGKFRTERVGTATLKGKSRQITVYRVLGKQDSSNCEALQGVEL
jgi:adenylate cyclase